MSERLVGLGHTVHFFLTLDSRAGVVARVDDLGAQALGHGLLAALAGELDQPAQGQGLTALRADLELHILYQPGAETMQEGDEEGAERELAAVSRT